MSRDKTDLRLVMVDTFMKEVEQGTNLMVLVSDSTSTSKIAPFAEKYPDRLVDVGIAEQNLVGVAAGMALGGYVAVTANAAPFLVARANEQVKNDVCYSQTNVKMVGLNAGFAYSNLGSTHHAIDDVAIMRGLGNVLIVAPSDPVETREIFKWALHHEGSVYIRLDSAKFPYLHQDDYRFKPGEPDIMKEGSDLTLCALGSVVHEADEAVAQLKDQGIDVCLINCSSIRPINTKPIVDSIFKSGRCITVEEHTVNGGLGSLVAEVMAEQGMSAKLQRLGITNGEFSKAGPRNEVRAYYKIDTAGIVETAKEMMKREAKVNV